MVNWQQRDVPHLAWGHREPQRDVLVEAALGALAGAAAAWVMGKATTFLYQQESEEAQKRENEARDG